MCYDLTSVVTVLGNEHYKVLVRGPRMTKRPLHLFTSFQSGSHHVRAALKIQSLFTVPLPLSLFRGVVMNLGAPPFYERTGLPDY